MTIGLGSKITEHRRPKGSDRMSGNHAVARLALLLVSLVVWQRAVLMAMASYSGGGSGDVDSGSGDVDSGSGDVDSGSGDVDSGSGDVDSGNGDVDSGSGDVDSGSGDVDSGSGDVDSGSGDVDSGSGDVGSGSGDVDSGSGDVDSGSGNVDSGSGDVDSGSGDVDSGSGDVDSGSGDVDSGSGDVDSGSGDVDSGSGDVDSGSGDVDSGSGDVDSGSGDVDSGSGDVDSGSGDVDSGSGEGSDLTTDTPMLSTASTLETTVEASTLETTVEASTLETTVEASTLESTTPVCQLTECQNGGTFHEPTCECQCSTSWSGPQCTDCPLTGPMCEPGAFDDNNCECVCPIDISGRTCEIPNPCLDTNFCPSEGQFCMADIYNGAGYDCVCNALDNYHPAARGICQRIVSRIFRLRVLGLNNNTVGFTSAYGSRVSTASGKFFAVTVKVILHVLQQSGITSGVQDVVGIRIVSGGSVIVELAAIFEEESSAPTVATIQSVIQSQSTLSDNVDNLEVDQSYVTTTTSTSGPCSSIYCDNGGVCEVNGLELYPIFSSTCRCQTSFTGERCETVLTVGPEAVTTVTTTTESPGLEPVAIVLIALGALVVIVLIVIMLMCMACLILRPRYKMAEHGRSGWGGDVTPPSPYGRHNYGVDYSGDQDWDSRIGDDARMDRLQQALGRSMHPQEYYEAQFGGFFRPFMASGNEDLYGAGNEVPHPTSNMPATSKTVYNPMNH